jgi:hypothetical protein
MVPPPPHPHSLSFLCVCLYHLSTKQMMIQYYIGSLLLAQLDMICMVIIL